jgi:hypothetical protein
LFFSEHNSAPKLFSVAVKKAFLITVFKAVQVLILKCKYILKFN